jgi:hypothetical protein
MTDAAGLRALAERVEGAEGADRYLDADVFAALHPDMRRCPRDPRAFISDDEEWLKTPPFYTASLDAAASLVPAGWAWCVHDVGIASLMRAPTVVKAQAATPALALTAAALRARAAMMEAQP